MRQRGYIRQRRPGVWEVSVPVPGSRSRLYETVHGSARDAGKVLTRMLREIDTGQRGEPSRMTLASFLASWLSDYADVHLRRKTALEYRRTIEHDIIPALGSRPLERLTPLELQGFYTRGLSQAREGLGRPLSSSSVRRWHIILHRALAHAVQWRLIATNPADAAQAPPARHAEASALTAPQATRLLQLARGRPLHVPIALALLAGLRRGEVFGLRWVDVDLAAPVIHVRQQLDYHANPPQFGPPKTSGSRRSVVIPERLAEILGTHRQEQTALRLLAAEAWQEHGLVCCRADGTPVCHDVNRDLDRILDQRECPLCRKLRVFARQQGPGWVCLRGAGGCGAEFDADDLRVRDPVLPRVTFHQLRHTHGSLLGLAGVPLKVVSERMGHSDPAFTARVYQHVFSEQERAAARKLDELL